MVPVTDKPPGVGADIVIADAQANGGLLKRWIVIGIIPDHSEGYALVAGGGNKGTSVIIAGHDAHGAYYGAQTLCQLMIKDHRGVSVVGAKVVDYPTLSWRGAHLFCGSQALPFHERLIALMSFGLKLPLRMDVIYHSGRFDQPDDFLGLKHRRALLFVGGKRRGIGRIFGLWMIAACAFGLDQTVGVD
jgi:hypothetical protein